MNVIYLTRTRVQSLLRLVLIALAILTATASVTSAQTDSSNANDCGDYDPSVAISFKNEYVKALRARDYARLKELKEQRKEVDLWAKSSRECIASDGSGEEQAADDDASGGTDSGSPTEDESDQCPTIQLNNAPTSLCVGETSTLTVSTDPKGKSVEISSASDDIKIKKVGSSFELLGVRGQKQPVVLSARSGSCDAQEITIDALPSVVNDLWNFPLVGDPEADDVNQAYAYMVEKCPSSGQNMINHSIDGCSGPAPQRLTERSGITAAQFEIFDKFRPGFEPIWGQERPNGLPSGSTDTLACNNHDICYQTCGETQQYCDSQLRQDIVASCDLAYPNPCPYTGGDNVFQNARNALKCQDYNSERTDCRDIAAWFETGLSLGGDWGGRPAFRTRQVQYCKCCDSI